MEDLSFGKQVGQQFILIHSMGPSLVLKVELSYNVDIYAFEFIQLSRASVALSFTQCLYLFQLGKKTFFNKIFTEMRKETTLKLFQVFLLLYAFVKRELLAISAEQLTPHVEIKSFVCYMKYGTLVFVFLFHSFFLFLCYYLIWSMKSTQYIVSPLNLLTRKRVIYLFIYFVLYIYFSFSMSSIMRP